MQGSGGLAVGLLLSPLLIAPGGRQHGKSSRSIGEMDRRAGDAMETWATDLREGRVNEAWDKFLERYRRLIFAAIRHYAQDYDDVMDVFANVCEALRSDDMRRLRARAEEPTPRAQFSTWLVAVVRNLTVDWFRHRDGRHRLSVAASTLPPLQRRIFQLVFLDQRSHVETYELIRAGEAPTLSFPKFLVELRATYAALSKGKRGQVLRDLVKVPSLSGDEHLAQGSELEHDERRRWLEQALAALPSEDQVAIQLYLIEELPAEQVARVLRLSNAKAVYNRVYRAVAALRARLEGMGIRPGDL
jgi:DNA-directed RNA polymerase specialized sigma24 family protein